MWALLCMGLVTAPWFDQGRTPTDVGEVPAAQLSAAACSECHPAQSAEWSQSRHANAWTGAIFQREYAAKPQQWCVNCHAPLTQQVRQVQQDGTGLLAAEGINCAACHLRDGRMVSRTRSEHSPHATVEHVDFGSPAFCGGCHEFNFPVSVASKEIRFSVHPMQKTLSEFARASAGPDSACKDCHGSDAGHRFPGGTVPQMVRDALRIEVCQPSATTVRVTMENDGAAHNVPTGGINRHLRLDVWRSAAPERGHETFIGRRFASTPSGKAAVSDSSLKPGVARTFDIDVQTLGGDGGAPVNVRLTYVFTPEHWGPLTDVGGEPAFYQVWARTLRAGHQQTCR